MLLPKVSAEVPLRLSFRGSHEQGGLVIGEAKPGASVDVDGQKLLVSEGGVFCFGLALDAEKPVTVTAVFADGVTEKANVVPTVRQYEEQRIDGLPQKYVEPPPEVLERIARERALVWDARKRETAGTGFAEPFGWPCAGIISGVYGSRRILNGVPRSPHLGVDIAAPEGTPILAPADGVVSLSEDFYTEGGTILIDHGHGVSSVYLHQSKRMVTAGETVKRGSIIGLVGQTGRATGAHVHWGLAWFQTKLDPSRITVTPKPSQPEPKD